MGSSRRAVELTYWSWRQKAVIGGLCWRIHSQNRSSFEPMSSSGPVIDVWAWRRKRRGGSQANRAESRGTPGTSSAACGATRLRTRISTPDGGLYKSTILDATTGLVSEQHLFTPAGERLASVRTSRHRVDPPSGAALPHRIEVSWPTSQLEFTLELTSITTNAPATDPGQLWQMPAYPGYEPVDLADPAVTIGPPAAP